jgi:hypothetical protein
MDQKARSTALDVICRALDEVHDWTISEIAAYRAEVIKQWKAFPQATEFFLMDNTVAAADELYSRWEAFAVFVFGSNLAGRHGKGAALHAREHRGAIYGRGEGLQGNSYAIPTKDAELKILPVDIIGQHVGTFLEHARKHPTDRFLVTRIGCGLAGYQREQIAPLFKDAPGNCLLPSDWYEALQS